MLKTLILRALMVKAAASTARVPLALARGTQLPERLSVVDRVLNLAEAVWVTAMAAIKTGTGRTALRK